MLSEQLLQLASYQRRVISLSEEWEWFHAFELELLQLFSHSEERHEFPRFGHRCCPDQPPAAPDVSKQATRSVVYRALPRPLTLATRPETDASLRPVLFR